MAKKICLLGGCGRNQQKVFGKLDKKLVRETKNKSIFIINLTTNNRKKLEEKKSYLQKDFHNAGYKIINFASDCKSNKEIKNKIAEAGVLFLAGGDTKILLDNIRKKKLLSSIKSFKGIIEGNSAGAYVCCRGYVSYDEKRIIPCFGLVNLYCKAHYAPKMDFLLIKLSKNKKIYAISEDSYIIYDGKLKFVGNVYEFFGGKKIKL